MKITRQNQHHGNFHQLGRLQFKKAEINPALRPHADMPGNIDNHQQHQRPEIKKISIAHQPPDVYQRQKQHQTETDGKTNQLVNRPRLPVAVGRRIKHNDADSRQRNNQQQISKAQVCQFFANGQRLIAKGCFIRLIHHSTVLTFSLTGSSFSVSSSSLEAIGAAAEEPPPPCSTKTATA